MPRRGNYSRGGTTTGGIRRTNGINTNNNSRNLHMDGLDNTNAVTHGVGEADHYRGILNPNLAYHNGVNSTVAGTAGALGYHPGHIGTYPGALGVHPRSPAGYYGIHDGYPTGRAANQTGLVGLGYYPVFDRPYGNATVHNLSGHRYYPGASYRYPYVVGYNYPYGGYAGYAGYAGAYPYGAPYSYNAPTYPSDVCLTMDPQDPKYPHSFCDPLNLYYP